MSCFVLSSQRKNQIFDIIVSLALAFHIRCFVFSSQRKNQIFDTIGILLHLILGEFYRRMPCLLSTMFLTYFLEIREEA